MKLLKSNLAHRRFVAVLLCCMAYPALPDTHHMFTPDWEEQWQHHSAAGVCALTLGLAEYGEARFVASASMTPVFELQARQDLHQPGAVHVSKFAPEWHPLDPLRETLGTIQHIEGGGALARGALAADMLLALRQGLHIELTAPAWFDAHDHIVLYLPAKDLQPGLGEFLDCAQTAVKVSWQQMSRTRISYNTGTHALSDTAKEQLRVLARYVTEDAAVNKLYVDGHTDASGHKKTNKQLSKRRAQTVAAYLREVGLTDRQIVVRYHGDAYPVSDNATVQGKAQNRRTTVRLERTAPSELARQ